MNVGMQQAQSAQEARAEQADPMVKLVAQHAAATKELEAAKATIAGLQQTCAALETTVRVLARLSR